MNGAEWQTEEFERQRPHLHAVAHRMLGSLSDADDVVQDAWLPGLVRGAAEMAKEVLTHGAPFLPRCRPAIVNGAVGLVVAHRGQPVGVVGFTIADGRITELDLIADPQKLRFKAPARRARAPKEARRPLGFADRR